MRRRHPRPFLVVVIDGDNVGVQRRKESLTAACVSAGVENRPLDGSVTILAPTWNIETWLAYLGGERVNESKSDYPRLARERDCQQHVVALAAMCAGEGLRQPAPPSLVDACSEYERLKEHMQRH